MPKVLSFREVLQEAPRCYAITSVITRNEGNVATGFVLLETVTSKKALKRVQEQYAKQGYDVIAFPTYNTEQAALVRFHDGEIISSPILTPAETAEFFRRFMGTD